MKAALRVQRRRAERFAGFTLIELLTVIAIVGILAALLFPALHSVRAAANKARTRVQFSQWSAAIESFRSEYGHYPVFDASNLVNGGVGADEHPFHDTLAGRRRDGAALADTGAAARQNRKRIPLHTFSASEFTNSRDPTPNLLCDAFGGTEIAVLVDRNLDGVLDAADFGALPLVGGARPTSDDFPVSGLRATVAFYSMRPGGTAERPDFVFSWK